MSEDHEAMRADFDALKRAFAAHAHPTLSERKAWLSALRSAVLENKDRFCEAVNADFGARSPIETLGAEVMIIDHAIKYLLANLGDFLAPEDRRVSMLFAPARAEVRLQPKGVVGVISPWNYPVQLAFVPIATALAAGNRVFLKPSELTPKTSALIAEVLAAALPEGLVAVVQGGAEVGAAFSALPFDHLVFTGSTAVGRHVMRAAAANLTPVTLELGGKSPAILHAKANLANAVERVVFGKLLNAGQTCIAVDYLLVPRELEATVVQALQERIRTFYATLATNEDYTGLVNTHHRDRVAALVEDARSKGATVLTVNPANEDLSATSKLAPVILQNVTDEMEVMREEIFGPVLPIVPYDTLEHAIRYVNERPRPLALYYFDTSRSRIDTVLQQTHAGGVCINDTMLHIAQDDLPFGGVGASGMGAYHGREGVLELSHVKPVFHQRRVRFTALFNPPYGRAIRTFLKVVVG